jgi:hypothetical protein
VRAVEALISVLLVAELTRFGFAGAEHKDRSQFNVVRKIGLQTAVAGVVSGAFISRGATGHKRGTRPVSLPRVNLVQRALRNITALSRMSERRKRVRVPR